MFNKLKAFIRRVIFRDGQYVVPLDEEGGYIIPKIWIEAVKLGVDSITVAKGKGEVIDSANLIDQLKDFYDEEVVLSKCSKSQLYSLGIEIANMLQENAHDSVADKRPEEVAYRRGLIKQREDILRTMRIPK